MAGYAAVATWFAGEIPGTANDGNGNGREEVATELIALTLSGTSPRLGEVILNQRPDRSSAGTIEELVNQTFSWLDLPPYEPAGQADSFFDVFFTIEITGAAMSNPSAHRVSGMINKLPTGQDDVLVGFAPVSLVDESGALTGLYLSTNRLQLGPITDPVGVDQLPGLANQRLTAVPNPFNPRVRIGFRLAEQGPAVLQVYDVQGRLVTTLHDGWLGAGERVLFWEGLDRIGRHVASGTYVLQLKTARGTTGRTISLIR